MREHGIKLDEEKIDYSLIDDAAEEEFAAVLTFGKVKYDRGNWKTLQDLEERYWAALRRHFRRYRAGERFDPETGGLHHLACAMCCIHFILAYDLAMRGGDLLADRFPEAMAYARKQRELRVLKEEAAKAMAAAARVAKKGLKKLVSKKRSKA